MEDLEFEWDYKKNEINKQKHNVSFEEAATVFQDEDALLISDPDHSQDEDRFIIMGIVIRQICWWYVIAIDRMIS